MSHNSQSPASFWVEEEPPQPAGFDSDSDSDEWSDLEEIEHKVLHGNREEQIDVCTQVLECGSDCEQDVQLHVLRSGCEQDVQLHVQPFFQDRRKNGCFAAGFGNTVSVIVS